MYVEQLYTGCLAEAAYYIESEGFAAIVDPIRDTDVYVTLAEKRGAKIKYIFETHFHADFVSGHLDLAKKTGATIVFGPTAVAKFEMYQAKDNEIFELGKVKIKALHTPGHTPESTCYLLIDEKGKESALFTGDTLFVGDVGRPDLLDGVIISKEEQVANLYHSLNTKIKTLPDDVIVYPGHGPGSLCGKSMGKETQSTIGKEKATNYALREQTMDEFVEAVLSDQLPAPQYFVKNAIINRTGYDDMDATVEKGMKALSYADYQAELKNGAVLLDVRSGAEFMKEHVKGSFQIGLDGSFAVWLGTMFDIKQRFVLVTEKGREKETVLRMARIGFENVAGYLADGVNTVLQAGEELVKGSSISAAEFTNDFKKGETFVLDVRGKHEYEAAHIENAKNAPVRDIMKFIESADKNTHYYVHCAGGYRSVIAYTFMVNNGLKATNVEGGFDALKNTSLPIVSEVMA
jgi:glyoxylase-like metal-dependent hydrolase (beta-lactamase superfamily II)/rhodanese-related sulfurtransferase